MKKRFFALLLGGVMAVGGLFLQMPVTAQAVKFDTCDDSSSHIRSSQLASTDGKLMVTIDIEFETEGGNFDLFVFGKKLIKYGEYIWLDMDDPSRVAGMEDLVANGTYTFDGLADGTYYAYCRVSDNHECHGWGENENPNEVIWHDAAYLGSVTVGSAPSESKPSTDTPAESTPSTGSAEPEAVPYEEKVADQIKIAMPGSTITFGSDVNTLSNATMKELLARDDVSARLEFTYEGKDYIIVIPAGKALDNDIPWYGPLYLAQQFGNQAENASSETGETYEVKSGDCLSRIAAANNMTLNQLLKKNPQIKDPNRISVGQIIHR